MWILLLCILFYIILEYIILLIIPYCSHPYKKKINIDIDVLCVSLLIRYPMKNTKIFNNFRVNCHKY